MAWSWRTPDDTDLAGIGGSGFPTRADAEAWLTETYQQLRAAGLVEVALYDEGRLVYGPVPLTS